MRVIVTGATGFLGGVLARLLRDRGHEVVATGRDQEKLAALASAGIDTIPLDLASRDAPSLDCDAFIHCAALSSPWGRHSDFYRANVAGTRGAIALARAAGARRFVNISTPSIYFRFQDQICVREDAPLPTPVNAYANSKRQAEHLVLAAHDLDPIILRPRGLYGPGDTTLLPRLLAAAQTRALPLMNEGRAATDLTYIDDVAEAAYAALTVSSPVRQRIFNISGGEALNVRQVAELAAGKAGCAVQWRKVSPWVVLAYARANEYVCALLPRYPEPTITAYGAALFAFTQTLNIDAARRELGWSPRVAFAEGLARTFA
ncbi:MAG: NAD(P)-dependent oxidoreductase [Alphaproteobacteria bacterium]|nr:NAD(P)-dependent oxidoreductase [Alphaproteobacteria bacterium]